MGLIAALAITVLIRLLSHILLFQKLLSLGENILNRLPLVKTIYSAIKDFIDYLSPDNKQAMSKVIMVRIPGQDFEQIGGYTLILPRSSITPIDMSFEEGMKLVLTGAITRNREGGSPEVSKHQRPRESGEQIAGSVCSRRVSQEVY